MRDLHAIYGAPLDKNSDPIGEKVGLEPLLGVSLALRRDADTVEMAESSH